MMFDVRLTALVGATCGVLLVLQVTLLVLVTKQDVGTGASGGTSSSKTTVTSETFGQTTAGKSVDKYTLTNSNGMIVEFITFGGIITAIKTADKDGRLADVTLGFDTLQDYESRNVPYFGALIGRVANRISDASFNLDGIEYRLNVNNIGKHHLHGGIVGWDKAVWNTRFVDGGVELSHVSLDGDEKYPGEVHVNVTYLLTDDNQLVLNYRAIVVDKATPISMTSHPYFNLAGEGSSHMNDHYVTIFADYYLPSTDELLPTGGVASVSGTLYDFRSPTRVGDVLPAMNITILNVTGYDNNFCVRGPTGTRLAARVRDSRSGRQMEVYTNQPGLQFYTANFLDGLIGKNGHSYGQHSAFCMETQNYPNAINNAPRFPDSVLRPGSVYEHFVAYKFTAV